MITEKELLDHYHSYVRSTAQNWFRARTTDSLEQAAHFAEIALMNRAEAFLAALVLGYELTRAQKEISLRLNYLMKEGKGE